MNTPSHGPPPEPAAQGPEWVLTLYVTGVSPQSLAAIRAARALCDEQLPGAVHLEVVDVREDPQRVIADGVIATPTLVKHMPLPLRRLVGDLSNLDRALVALDVRPVASPASEKPPEHRRGTTDG